MLMRFSISNYMSFGYKTDSRNILMKIFLTHRKAENIFAFFWKMPIGLIPHCSYMK